MERCSVESFYCLQKLLTRLSKCDPGVVVALSFQIRVGLQGLLSVLQVPDDIL